MFRGLGLRAGFVGGCNWSQKRGQSSVHRKLTSTPLANGTKGFKSKTALIVKLQKFFECSVLLGVEEFSPNSTLHIMSHLQVEVLRP